MNVYTSVTCSLELIWHERDESSPIPSLINQIHAKPNLAAWSIALQSLTMDPLSIAASSAGLVSLCTAISTSLYKFIRDSLVIDQALEAFRDEVGDLEGVLASIKSSFSDDRIAKAALCETTGHELQHWQKAKRSMDDCRRTLERLSSLLEQVRGGHGHGRVFFPRQRRQIRLDMNSTEIVALRQQIQSYKDTMKLSFHVIAV